jgi:Xaa-Pro aminopeptidase
MQSLKMMSNGKRGNDTMVVKQLRISKARELLAHKKIDALLIFSQENRQYLSGFSAVDHQFEEIAGSLLITQDENFIITDSRFDLQAQAEAPDWRIVIYKHSLAKEIADLIQKTAIDTIGFESSRVSVHQYQDLDSKIQQSKLIPLADLSRDLRQIKDADEIANTYQALGIAESVFRQVAKGLQPGMSEKAIAWDIERRLREAGAEDLSFPVIVASGPNSALPHAVPTDRCIGIGEPILIDWGCKLHGYCSDTTRTLVLGSPDDTLLKVHHCVREAQQLAIAAIKAGANTRVVDAVARDHIHNNGYQGKFGHGLGHGTGLAVHEAPRLSPIKESILEAGMIVTVEPGIYLPEWGGVRIEHQVVVRSHGAEVMNQLSTDYNIARL